MDRSCTENAGKHIPKRSSAVAAEEKRFHHQPVRGLVATGRNRIYGIEMEQLARSMILQTNNVRVSSADYFFVESAPSVPERQDGLFSDACDSRGRKGPGEQNFLLCRSRANRHRRC